MRLSIHTASLTAVLLGAVVARGVAQEQGTVMTDLVRDVSQVEEKLLGLARAMSAEQYSWRPGEGVRSVGEVFQHVAADNYLLPALVGTAPPAATGIKSDDYATVRAYETREADRATIIADLEASFAHLKEAMSETPSTTLGDTISLFGREVTTQPMWVLTTTHLHEHLGQSIAYARTNGVTPPWSR